MTANMIDSSKQTARLAGLLYLLLIPIGFFGMAYISGVLVEPDNIAATMENIVAAESLVRLSLVSAFLMNIIMITLVLVLYRLFSPAGKNSATFMVTFGLVGVGIGMLNEVNNFAVLTLSGAEAGTIFSAEQAQYLVGLFLDMRKYGLYIAHIFWGLWLLPLGYLLFKYGILAKIVGISLFIAGAGYVIDSLVLFLAPHHLIPITDYTFIGEVLVTLWLLFAGTNVEESPKPSLELARS